MKKLVVLAMVLAVGGAAGAGLSVSVVGHPDMTIVPSETVTLQIISSGEVWNISLFILASGPSTVSIDDAVVIGNPASEATGALGVLDFTGAEGLEAYTWALYADMAKAVGLPPAIPNGVVVDGISLHCEGPGDVVIELWDFMPNVWVNYGTYVIHQVPEPMTLGLLGLGGLMLRRRRL